MHPSSAQSEAATQPRYSRQVLLDEIGLAGQRKLTAARVLVVGAGGLGSPAALYLAAGGVGTLGIADMDRVEEHNLQRQLLHATADVGRPKVESAAETLRALNPLVTVVTHPEGVTVENAVAMFECYDVIVDGTDNFAARYLINDAAWFAGKPLVHGSVFKFEGQLSVFDARRDGPCYRCLFPEPPAAGSVPGCGEAGVLGALCGVIGSMQALEAIKLVTDCAPPLRGRLLTYDARSHTQQILAVPKDPQCPLCGRSPRIHTLREETQAPRCDAIPSSPIPMNDTEYPKEVTVAEADALLKQAPTSARLIDVREPIELDYCRIEGAEHIPMREIPTRIDDLPRDQHLLILCHHGGRSYYVAEFLRSRGFTAVSNISGGIDAWALELDSSLPRY